MTALPDAGAGVRRTLSEAPAFLAPRDRAVVWTAAVAAAFSRFLAVARTPWDWDEMLFSLGVRDFDVTRHHPHPPGFPLFVGAGKVLHLAGMDEFRALQALDLFAAILLFPALFFLFREARARFGVALCAALLIVFSPNVWFFGGTAFSDVPSLALIAFALALLFRSVRNPALFPIAAGLIALAAAVRPQNLLVALIPSAVVAGFLLRSGGDPVTRGRNDRQRIVTSGLLLALIIGVGCYAGAVMASGGWPAYHAAVVAHSHYIQSADSFLSPGRPSLWRVSDDFFLRPYRQPVLNVSLALLGFIGLLASIRGRGTIPVALIASAFLPIAVISWLFLDFHSVSRFSIAYSPLPLLLAAVGIEAVSATLGSKRVRDRSSMQVDRAAAVANVVITAILLGFMIVWTLPALAVVRSTVAPPVAAVRWMGQQIERRNATLSVSPDMSAYVQYFLPRFEFVPEKAPAPRWTSRPGWFLTDVDPKGTAKHFARFRGALWNIARQRYFDVWLVPIHDSVLFGSGWFGEEGSGSAPFRWMSGTSEMQLPPFAGGATLFLSLATPAGGDGSAVVTIAANGAVVERFPATPAGVEISHRFDARETVAPIEITIHVDRTIRPSTHGVPNDQRDLGLRLGDLNWR